MTGALRYLWLLSLGRGLLNWWTWMRRSGTVVLALYASTFAVMVLISVRQAQPPPPLPTSMLAVLATSLLLSGCWGRWPPLWLDSRDAVLILTPLPTRWVLLWPFLRAVGPGAGWALLLGIVLVIFSQAWELPLLLPALMIARFILMWLTYIARQASRSTLPLWALATLPLLGWFGQLPLDLAASLVLGVSVGLGWSHLHRPPVRLIQHAGTLWQARLRKRLGLAKAPLRMEQARLPRRTLPAFPASWGAAGALMWRTTLQLRTAPGTLIWGIVALSAALTVLSLTTSLPAQLLAGVLTFGVEPFTRLLGPAPAPTWPVSARANWLGRVVPGSLLGGVMTALLILLSLLLFERSLAVSSVLVVVALLLPVATLSLMALLVRWLGDSTTEVRLSAAVGVSIITASVWVSLPVALLWWVPLVLLALTELTRRLTVASTD